MENHQNKKSKFIEWLLEHYRHENPTVNYILRYILDHANVLQYIEFTEHSRYAPRAFYISYLKNTKEPFIYYKNNLKYTLSEQAFHDLRLNQKDPQIFYIELDIPHLYERLFNYDIFIENPYSPRDDKLENELDLILHGFSKNMAQKELRNAMDDALDKNDFEAVEYYYGQLQQLEREYYDH